MKATLLSIVLIFSGHFLIAQSWVLIDINPTGNSDAVGFTKLGNEVIFSANNGSLGRELWKTNGTVAGTSMIMDINPGSMNSNPDNLYPFNGWVFFSATNGTDGIELWKTDGTMGGTVMVKDILPAGDGSPSGFCEAGGQLFFSAGGPSTVDKELWVSDGSTGGTNAVMSSGDPGYVEIAYDSKVEINGKCVFFMHTFSGGHEVGVSDGTSGGTEIFDINTAGPSYPAYLTKVGDVAYFQADDGTSGSELWKTNGTFAGTERVKDIIPGSPGPNMHSLQPAVFADTSTQLIFVANTPDFGYEIWVSNGTEEGTKILRDLYPGTAGVDPWSLTAIANQLFFTAFANGAGFEPYRGLQLNISPTNGASLVGIDTSEIIPGIEGSWASEFTAVPEVVPGQENQAIVAFTAEANSWGDRHVFIYEELIQFTSTVLSAADSIAQVAIDAVMIEPPSATEPNPAVTTQPYEFDNRLVLVSDFDANGNEIWVYIPAFLTGEKDEPISSYFSIYPNPSIGMLRIEIPDNERSNYEIVLTDLSGRIVHTFNSGTLTGGLTLNQEIPSQISNGTYLVKLKTENQIQGRKLVLNR